MNYALLLRRRAMMKKSGPSHQRVSNGVYIAYVDGSVSQYDTLVSGKTPLGVVLKTDEVSLLIHPTSNTEQSSLAWGIDRTTLIDGVTTTNDANVAKIDYKGHDNYEAILRSAVAGPAFAWIQDNIAFLDGSVAWLASCGEAELIRINRNSINTAMELIGGDKVFYVTSTYSMPSSTQASAGHHWAFDSLNQTWRSAINTTTGSSRKILIVVAEW